MSHNRDLSAAAAQLGFHSSNIGIGSEAPRYPLDVYNGNLLVSGSSAGNLILEDRGVADSSRPFHVVSSDGGKFVINRSNRNASGTTTSSVNSLTLSSSGNLGLGQQTSPAANIHIGDISSGYELKVTGNALQFNRSSNSYIDQLHDTGSILFRMTSSNTEAMRITSSGNIGINDSGPNFHLDVDGNIGVREGQVLTWHDGSGNKAGDVYMDSSDNFVIRNTSSVTERLRIDSNGRILIGRSSTSQGHTLQVQASSGANAIAIQGRSVDDQSEITFLENDNSTILGQIQHLRTHSTYRHRVGYLRFDTGGYNEKMRLDANGYLGLNNAAPHNQYYNNLVIGDGSAAGDKGITIRTQSSNEGVIAFSDADSGAARYAGKIAYNHGTNAMMFFTTNGDERLRVDSSGRLLVGTTSADSNTRLHVSAAENTSDPMATDASIVIANTQNAGNNEAAALKFNVGNTNTASISAHYDSFSAGVNSSLRFYTQYQSGFNSPAERMRIDPRGRVTTPEQPAFKAKLSAATGANFSGVLVFNSVSFNIGNNYNSSNGRFTAPVDGRYLFNWYTNVELASSAAVYVDWMINGNVQGNRIYTMRTTGWEGIAGSIIFDLNTNDYLQIYAYSSGNYDGGQYGAFSGCLLG